MTLERHGTALDTIINNQTTAPTNRRTSVHFSNTITIICEGLAQWDWTVEARQAKKTHTLLVHIAAMNVEVFYHTEVYYYFLNY